MNDSDNGLRNTMDQHYAVGDDEPEWLQNWWIQQEAERERLRKLGAEQPGTPFPEPPTRPPKRLELRTVPSTIEV